MTFRRQKWYGSHCGAETPEHDFIEDKAGEFCKGPAGNYEARGFRAAAELETQLSGAEEYVGGSEGNKHRAIF